MERSLQQARGMQSIDGDLMTDTAVSNGGHLYPSVRDNRGVIQ